MELYRLGIKFFIDDPSSLSLSNFVPVFHEWIRKQILDDHLLIDIHDYSHIHNGPGILLVAHEGNFSIDMSDGRAGLFYYRKQPPRHAGEDLLATVAQPALHACSLLEGESSISGPLRFKTDELLIIANDRLQAPNGDQTLSQLQPSLSEMLNRLLDTNDFTIVRVNTDSRERFTARIQTPRSLGVQTLLSRIPRHR